jgi:hypothetical protein
MMVARRIRDAGSTPRLLAWPKVVGAVGAGIDTGCRKVSTYSARLAEALTNAARWWGTIGRMVTIGGRKRRIRERYVAGSRVLARSTRLAAAPTSRALQRPAAVCDPAVDYAISE